MPGDAELERIGIKIVVDPQETLAATVHTMRAARKLRPVNASDGLVSRRRGASDPLVDERTVVEVGGRKLVVLLSASCMFVTLA